MSTSPDQYQAKRERISDLKSNDLSLVGMELRSHSNTMEEYSKSILYCHLELENIYKPLPALISQQPEIKAKMRYLVIDYLLDIINKYQLSHETFFTTINIMDRYSSVRIVRKNQYQLVGLCCLWISSKYHEKKSKIPPLDHLIKLCCNCYNKKLFLEMEKHVLSSIDWCLSSNLENLLDLIISKQEQQQKQSSSPVDLSDLKECCIYMCSLAQFGKISLHHKASIVACASLSLSLKALNSNTTSLLNNNLEVSLVRLLFNAVPSSMVTKSKTPAVLKLKTFYKELMMISSSPLNRIDNNEQLLTPPGSSKSSVIDAGINNYIVIPTTPLANEISSINDPAHISIYPSPVDINTNNDSGNPITPPQSESSIKRKFEYEDESFNEYNSVSKRFHYDSTEFFYEN
ncbi:hypothetical protein PACTADRAFT_47596 [Pachysolen tannophilus NRRL Y-2460]|uniref:Cyclin-like domain-containing protein n=1 Tax=Pachysolen tannophilus NRRL Y-2460 TaxID=669874 RepID=A0A1E4U192_PACTA|nr:hypothetical protein PACTADRAFT_47596 [Pachysolen tannophilus NRRL Y-2460]